MSIFKYHQELLLTDKIKNENQVIEYFENLKNYFASVSGNDFEYDDDAKAIKVDNNYLSPPIRFFDKRIPSGKKYIFFNSKINVIVSGEKLKVSYEFNYAIAVLLYLLWMLSSFVLVYSQLPPNTNIYIPILFFAIFETLIFTIVPLSLTITFKKNIAELFNRNVKGQ